MANRQRINRLVYTSGSWLNRHSTARIALIAGAVLMAVISLFVSDRLVRQMAKEERAKMEIWAQATQALASSDYSHTTDLMARIISQNESIPVILTDEQGQILSYNNIDLPRRDPEKYLYDKLQVFRNAYQPIVVETMPMQYLYYYDSPHLSQLVVFPYIQLGVFVVILGIALLAITSLKHADQNSIWEGLSRETAHQLGTPISSLMAWREILASASADPMVLREMDKDIHRLEIIADRFQKIGSIPNLKPLSLSEIIHRTVAYLQPRISSQVQIEVIDPSIDSEVLALMSEPLIGWVLENLIKNAVDAIQAKGQISIKYGFVGRDAYCDVADTGRGIPWGKFETIFRPGYSTRQRGWGLGLSLARRIVEDYHGGRIFVKHSEVGVGTTFRIILKRFAEHSA